jgi:hypothetical protein
MRRPQPTPRPGSPRRHPRHMRSLDSFLGALSLLSGRQGILAGIFMAILLVATGVGLIGAGRLDARLAHTSGQAQVRQAKVPIDLPAEGHWVDTTDNTAYQVQLKPNSDGFSTFAFTNSLGQQVAGTLPLVTLSDGTLAQEIGLTAGATGLASVAPLRCLEGNLQGESPVPILFTFLAHISSDGLAAFATLSYANARDPVGTTNLCKLGQGTTGVTTYQLLAGCTLETCTELATLTGPDVAKHDTALLAAEKNGNVTNWTAVYQLTSRQVTAQYSPEDFAALLNRQVKSVGKITAISAPSSNPPIDFTPEGQAYFSVQQTVTYQHGGSSHTRTLISYYVLENGTWLFWFTE